MNGTSAKLEVQRLFPTSAIVGSTIYGFVTLSIYFLFTGGATFSPSTLGWGSFGEYVGGMSVPVVGLLTIVGVLRSLRNEARQLALQNEQTEVQQGESRQQRFDSVFFGLLEAHYHVIESCRLGNLRGYEALQGALHYYKKSDTSREYAALLEPFYVSVINLLSWVDAECPGGKGRYFRIAYGAIFNSFKSFLNEHSTVSSRQEDTELLEKARTAIEQK